MVPFKAFFENCQVEVEGLGIVFNVEIENDVNEDELEEFRLEHHFPNYFQSLSINEVVHKMKQVFAHYFSPFKVSGASRFLIKEIVSLTLKADPHAQIYISGDILIQTLGYIYSRMLNNSQMDDTIPWHEVGVGSKINFHIISEKAIEPVHIELADPDIARTFSLNVSEGYPSIHFNSDLPSRSLLLTDGTCNLDWLQDFMTGQFEFPSTKNPELQIKAFNDILTSIAQLPFLTMKKSSSLTDFLHEMKDGKSIQFPRNVRHAFGYSRVYKIKKADSFDKIVHDWMIEISNPVIPEFMPVNQTWGDARKSIEDSYCLSENSEKDLAPLLFHGTRNILNLPSLLLSGPLISKSSYPGDISQGLSNYGSGFYVTPKISEALGYGSSGLTILYSWKPHAKRKVVEFLRSEFLFSFTSGLFKREELLRKFDADLVLNIYGIQPHYTLHSLKSIENPSSLSDYFLKMKSFFTNVSKDDKDYLCLYLMHFTASKYYGIECFESPFIFYKDHVDPLKLVQLFYRHKVVFDDEFYKTLCELYSDDAPMILDLLNKGNWNEMMPSLIRKEDEKYLKIIELFADRCDASLIPSAFLLLQSNHEALELIGLNAAKEIISLLGLNSSLRMEELDELFIAAFNICFKLNIPSDFLTNYLKRNLFAFSREALALLNLDFKLKFPSILHAQIINAMNFDSWNDAAAVEALFNQIITTKSLSFLIELKFRIKLTPTVVLLLDKSLVNLVIFNYLMGTIELDGIFDQKTICSSLVSLRNYISNKELSPFLHLAASFSCPFDAFDEFFYGIREYWLYFPFDNEAIRSYLNAFNFSWEDFIDAIDPRFLSKESAEKIEALFPNEFSVYVQRHSKKINKK